MDPALPASSTSPPRDLAQVGGLLPVVTPPAAVPVYDCHIILEGPDADGVWSGRVTNLPDIVATAKSERELLRRLVDLFQQQLRRLRWDGVEIPWNREAARPAPAPGQRQRWVPVHL
jgi:predicted RNase H-like HicB family nuclease